MLKGSIISQDSEKCLQGNLNTRIPIILEGIRKMNISHIILCEKTARLFKKGFISILKHHGLGSVKVGTFAPDYFNESSDTAEEQFSSKLSFLGSDKDFSGKIFIFDEIISIFGFKTPIFR